MLCLFLPASAPSQSAPLPLLLAAIVAVLALPNLALCSLAGEQEQTSATSALCGSAPETEQSCASCGLRSKLLSCCHGSWQGRCTKVGNTSATHPYTWKQGADACRVEDRCGRACLTEAVGGSYGILEECGGKKCCSYWRNKIPQVVSQGKQDSRLEFLFEELHIRRGSFVEFGCPGLQGANTAALEASGWRGVRFDGQHQNIRQRIYKHWISTDTIVPLFRRYGVDREVDYVSIDIDSADIWIFEAIVQGGYRPKVFTVEYNSCRGGVRSPFRTLQGLSMPRLDFTSIGTEDASMAPVPWQSTLWRASTAT